MKTTVKALDHFKVATKSGIRMKAGIRVMVGIEYAVDNDVCSRKHGF